MVPAHLHKLCKIFFPPFPVPEIVAVFDLPALPCVETLRHHPYAFLVADVQHFRIRLVVGRANRIYSDFLQEPQLAAEGRSVPFRTDRSEVVMQANASEFDLLSVDEKAIRRRFYLRQTLAPVGTGENGLLRIIRIQHEIDGTEKPCARIPPRRLQTVVEADLERMRTRRNVRQIDFKTRVAVLPLADFCTIPEHLRL